MRGRDSDGMPSQPFPSMVQFRVSHTSPTLVRLLSFICWLVRDLTNCRREYQSTIYRKNGSGSERGMDGSEAKASYLSVKNLPNVVTPPHVTY